MFDIWRPGYIRRSLTSVVDRPPVADEIRWLPARPELQFWADPFGMERDGVLTVFAEAYDYRVRRGEIHWLQYDAADRLLGKGLALSRPWHLSYPQLIEDGGDLFMLPEAHKSRRLTLYRCERFPDRWTPVARLLDLPAVDATVFRHDGQWRMLFCLPGPDERAMRELHVATAPALTGPWTVWPEAVSTGLDRSRPGGGVFLRDGALHLPVQDCSETYGGALNLLRLDDPHPASFRSNVVGRLEPNGLLPGFEDGLHTLTGSGDVTFIDVKRLVDDPRERAFKRQAKFRKLFGLNRPASVPTAWARDRAPAVAGA